MNNLKFQARVDDVKSLGNPVQGLDIPRNWNIHCHALSFYSLQLSYKWT